MSKWTNATLTADGQNLQAQLLDGGGFEFTKVTAADSSGTDKLTLTMQPSVIDGKTITVPVLLSNSNLSAGFTMNQLKFYARKTGIPAGDEIVYAIAEDETGDEIPSESDSPGFTIDWSYTFQFGNATSVNVSIDPAGLVSMALLGNPGGIATLNNAGAVPIEQGGTGAVTASAALAALGGMRASATGDDIPTSASDPTSISSQLSNAFRHLGTIRGYSTVFDAVKSCTIDSSFFVVINSSLYNAEDSAFLESEVVYLVLLDDAPRKTVIAIRYWPGNPQMAIRCLNGDRWIDADWIYFSTATPPQEFDLPLADGITALQPCTYWKNQFGEVTIYGCTYGSVTEGETIATLPEGFRPDHPVEWPASFTGDGGRVSGTVFISESGIVSIHTTAPAMSVVFAASFLAVD